MSSINRTCFIIMPITIPNDALGVYTGDSDHFLHVLEYLFVPAIEKIGYSAITPVATGADIIHAEIIRNLETADLVLCDMSTLNPNVFFELGIRTAVDKPVCLVKDNYTDRVPFDTNLINHHTYDARLLPWHLINEVQRLREHLLKSINNSGTRNTLWKYFGLTTRAESPAPSSTDEKLDFIIKSLERTPKANPILSIGTTSINEPLASEKEVVKLAQALATKIEAEFAIIDIAPNKILLDLGGFVMDESYKQQIIRLGRERGVEVIIQEGDGIREY